MNGLVDLGAAGAFVVVHLSRGGMYPAHQRDPPIPVVNFSEGH